MDSNNDKQEEDLLSIIRDNISLILIIGVIGVLVAPFLLTRATALVDFTDTGPIGDTIGGTTAPIIGLISAILVFLSFKEQIKANKLLNEQIQQAKQEQYIEKTMKHLEEALNSFIYTDILEDGTPLPFVSPGLDKKNAKVEVYEGSRFFKYLNQNLYKLYLENYTKYEEVFTTANRKEINYFLKAIKNLCIYIEKRNLKHSVEYIGLLYWYNTWLLDMKEIFIAIRDQRPRIDFTTGKKKILSGPTLQHIELEELNVMIKCFDIFERVLISDPTIEDDIKKIE